jgi:hypothetical protein
MVEIVVLVQGSAPEPYEVVFRKDGDRITASCTCPAGAFSRLCKHRLRIMSGDHSGIISENLPAVLDVQTWVSGTNIGKALLELHDAERQLEQAKKRIGSSKKRLADFLGE